MALYIMYIIFTYVVGLLAAGYFWGLTDGLTKGEWCKSLVDAKPITVLSVIASPLLVSAALICLFLVFVLGVTYFCFVNAIELTSRLFIFENP